MRNTTTHQLLLLLLVSIIPLALHARTDRHWVGGDGAWGDAMNWSATTGGPAGAGVPDSDDHVHVAPGRAVRILVDGTVNCASLHLDGTQAEVTLAGSARSDLRIASDLLLVGEVHWEFAGTTSLIGRDGGDLHTRGVPLAGDLVVEGGGEWTMRSDLVLGAGNSLRLRRGTLRTAGSLLRAGDLQMEGNRDKRFVADGSVVLLGRAPNAGHGELIGGSGTLLVNGRQVPWDTQETIGGGDRDVNICGNGPGQTQFIVDATLQSNYNGFGVSCKGACDGAVTVEVSGGVGPFTYQWVSGPTTPTWNSVCAGNQIVIVTDQGQSISCAATINVTDPPLLSVIFSGLASPSCAGVCDGSASVFAVGGAGSYSYIWNGGTETGSSAFQLCAGENTLLVTDANNCQFDTTFTIDLEPIVPNLETTDADCFGACNATASVSPDGGTGNFTYLWGPGIIVGQGTPNVEQLCAGDYAVTITDSNGCDTTVVFTITEPPPVQLDTSVQDASCASTCDGTIGVVVSGADGPFTYVWDPEPGSGQGTPDADGLCAGNYTLLVTDLSSGCDTLLLFEVLEPDVIDPQPDQQDASCADACDGSAEVAPIGGAGGFVFLWAPEPPIGQGSAAAGGLCPGEWQVTITDQAGCDTTVSFLIEAPPPIDPAATFTDITCNGACDGTAEVDPVGGVAPYSFNWTPEPPVGQGTAAAEGLCAGDWSVTISDDNGCDTTVVFTISEPPPIEAEPEQTDVGCGGACDGTATVTATGGTGDLEYLWEPEPPQGQGTASASELCAGDWSVTITDDNGCMLVVDFTIAEPSGLEISLQIADAACANLCDGAAGVIVTGGTEPYTYAWSPEPGIGQGTSDVEELCPGPYLLTITDAAGCDSTIAFTIEAPDALIPNETVTNVSCAGQCDGSITLAPDGGDGTYTYVWDPVPPNGQGNAEATSLCAGIYSVVIASAGCDTTLVLEVIEPDALDASVVFDTPSCTGDCDATAEVTVDGGTPPYAFLWSPEPGSGQGTTQASGLCAGDWSVLVTDAAGCDTLLVFMIEDPEPIDADLETTAATCDGGCDGMAEVDPSGGTAPYTFLWTPEPGSGQGTSLAEGLCPGDYSVLISDALGCDTLIEFIIEQPSGIIAEPQVTDASCFNTCDGAVTIDVLAGLEPLTYAWSPEPGTGQGTPTATGLCVGDWAVLITDAAGCDTLVLTNIGAPPPIDPFPSHTNETCNGPCDGTASVSPAGGEEPFTFVWSPEPPQGQGTTSATGLCAGTWEVLITDAAGCDTTVVFDILPEQPLVVDINSVDATCFGACNGTATVEVSGGTEPYTYLWSPEPAEGQGTPSVSGLCEGDLSVTVTDAAGCDTIISVFIDKLLPIEPSLAVQSEDCTAPCTGGAAVFPSGGNGGPYTFLWSPEPGSGQGTFLAEGLCAGEWSVTITDSIGCDTTVTFTVDLFTPIVPNLSSTPVSCPGACDGSATVGPTGGIEPYTYFWAPEPTDGQGTPQATGLCAGVYTVTITDDAACDTTITVLILGPDSLDAGATVQDISCFGLCDGSIVLAPQGGTAPYTYAWDPVPSNGDGGNAALDLCAGTWEVTLTDANGCDMEFAFEITEPPLLEVDLSTTQSTCQDCIAEAAANITGGSPPYQIAWTDDDGILIGTDPTITDLCAGTYNLLVTDDAGCSEQMLVAISDSDGEEFSVTGSFTSCPNVCDGIASIDLECLDPPCTIAWSDAFGNTIAQDTTAVDGLCAGDYLVQVTNGSGCITLDTAVVIGPDPVVPNLSSSPVTCAGDCDGVATVGPTGGIPPYDFIWSPEPGDGQGTPQATGLCAGTYDVLITDASGCDTTVSVLILEPDQLVPQAVVQQIACAGTCDGSIVVSPQGGTAPYTFAWTPVPPNGDGGNAAFDLCAGDWSVTVTDANGCDTTLDFQITEPLPLLLSAAVTNSQCQLCDGTISLSIDGGTAPYLIAWEDPDGLPVGDQPDLTDLCAGLYTVTVTDAAGCVATLLVPVVDIDGEEILAVDGQTSCANDCDGEVSVSFVCAAPPCGVIWTDMLGNTIATDVQSVTDLCVGDYLVQVTNGAGCISIDTASVVPGLLITPNLSSSAASCAGACDGIATVGPTGGTEPYTFDWSPEPGDGQGTPQASGLCAGVYSVVIADALGCDTTVTVLILEPDPLTVDAVVQDIACAGSCDGSIVLTPLGGTAPYTFAWDPVPPNGDGSNAALDLCAGEWSVTLVDANGCDTTLVFEVVEPDPLVLTGTSTPSECGVCDGTAGVVPIGGTPPYTYAWTDPDGIPLAGDETIEGLCAGLYNVVVTDAEGCQEGLLVPVQDEEGEETEVTNGLTSCPGECDASVSVDLDCQSPPCTIAWYDDQGNDLGESGQVLEGLCAGTYFVEVVNGIGCVAIDTAFVLEPDPIIPNLSTQEVSCAGACDGVATVGPTGGVEPYEYLWDPEPDMGQGTPQATGLCAGEYTVLITDAEGCSLLQGVLILEPDTLEVPAQLVPPTCSGDCDGAIVLGPTGGTAPYTYVWDPVPPNGQGGNAALELCSGTYSVTVSDANGCDTTVVFVLDDPAPIAAEVVVVDNLCFGGCEGTATAIVSGGQPPMVLTWTDVDGLPIAGDQVEVNDLCSATYILVVTDAAGCELQVPFLVEQGEEILADLQFTNESCFGPCDGTAAVAPSGGEGPYTILWDPEPGDGQGTEQVSGLCAGTWSVTITDALGCDSTFTFEISPFQPIEANADVSDVLCNGDCDGFILLAPTGGNAPYTYEWSPEPPSGQGISSALALCPGIWSVAITDAAGCDTVVEFLITEPPLLVLDTMAVTPASCANADDGAVSITITGGVPSYSFEWTGPGGSTSADQDLVNVGPGDYDLVVTDQNGCVVTLSVTVPALSTVVADAGVDQMFCAGEVLILDGSASSGAMQLVWSDPDGNVLGEGALLDLGILPAGTYTFTLAAIDGVCTETDEVTVVILDLPNTDAGPDQVIFLGETVTLGGSPSGPAGSSFSWTPDSLVSDGSAPNPLSTPSITTWYFLTVTGPNGCTAIDSVLITVVPDIDVPSGFTPNGDGWNDTWIIDHIDLFPLVEVEVYNRWGELLFQSVGYNTPWDGRYNGGLVPVGTYYFVIKLNDPEFPEPITGPLTVIR